MEVKDGAIINFQADFHSYIQHRDFQLHPS